MLEPHELHESLRFVGFIVFLSAFHPIPYQKQKKKIGIKQGGIIIEESEIQIK